MLQRFLHSDVGYVERELEALPNLKTMIEEQTRYYEGADATLYDLFQSHAEHKHRCGKALCAWSDTQPSDRW